MAARLAVIAVVASLAQDVVATVNCGGHFADNCTACPEGNADVWCNGDCDWVSTGIIDDGGIFEGGGVCVPKLSLGPMDTQGTYYYLIAFCSTGIIMLAAARVYYLMVIEGPPPLPKVTTTTAAARQGLFACIKWPLHTCLYVTLCPPIVAGKNYYATEVCPFWPGCLFTFFLTYSPLFPLGLVIRALLAGRVQEKLGLQHTCFMDFLYAVFCFPCDLGRESLEVDEELGAEIHFSCKATIINRVVQQVVNIGKDVGEKADQRSCSMYRVCPGPDGN